jgi:hypothetical protein
MDRASHQRISGMAVFLEALPDGIILFEIGKGIKENNQE